MITQIGILYIFYIEYISHPAHLKLKKVMKELRYFATKIVNIIFAIKLFFLQQNQTNIFVLIST